MKVFFDWTRSVWFYSQNGKSELELQSTSSVDHHGLML